MPAEKNFNSIKITTKKGKTPNKALITEKGLWSILIIASVIIFAILLVAILLPTNFGQFLYLLFLTPINSFANFGNFLGQLAWLIIIGLSLMVSFRVGVFNIGACAQFMGGAMVGYTVALAFGGSGWIGVPLVLLTAVLTGAFIGWIIAKFKTIFGIHEVLTSIMFNWIVFYLVLYLTQQGNVTFFDTNGDLIPDQITNNFLRWNWANELFGGALYLNYGVPIAIILLILFWFLYKKTTWGYKQDILGSNINVSDYMGINKNKEWERTIAISGGLAGLAGVIYYLSILGNVNVTILSDLPTQAFLGITIALLGFCNPIGIAFSAFLIAYLTSSLEMIYGLLDMDIVSFIMAMLILIIAMVNYFIIVKPQEKWFKKNLDTVPWEEHELDIKNMSKYVTLIQDNLDYDTYDINEAKIFIKYYDQKIVILKQQYANKLENLDLKKELNEEHNSKAKLVKNKKLVNLRNTKEQIQEKIIKLNNKYLSEIENLEKEKKAQLEKEKNVLIKKLNNKIARIEIQIINLNKSDLKLKLDLKIQKLQDKKTKEQKKIEIITKNLPLKNEELFKKHQQFIWNYEDKNVLKLIKKIENLEQKKEKAQIKIKIIFEQLNKKNQQLKLVKKQEKLENKINKNIFKLTNQVKKLESKIIQNEDLIENGLQEKIKTEEILINKYHKFLVEKIKRLKKEKNTEKSEIKVISKKLLEKREQSLVVDDEKNIIKLVKEIKKLENKEYIKELKLEIIINHLKIINQVLKNNKEKISTTIKENK